MELLKSLGADVVVTPALLGNPDAYARAVTGLARPRLALNCTGGSIAASVSVYDGVMPGVAFFFKQGCAHDYEADACQEIRGTGVSLQVGSCHSKDF